MTRRIPAEYIAVAVGLAAAAFSLGLSVMHHSGQPASVAVCSTVRA